MFKRTIWEVMAHCGLLVCLATLVVEPSTDSCTQISHVLSEKFQKHTRPTDVQNLYTCRRGVTCCNTISEFFFQHNVENTFTKFALYTVNTRLNSFKDSVYAPQVNWETFNSLIAQYESGHVITYEHFFETALLAIIPLKEDCLKRTEIKQLKKEAMGDIKVLVDNIYAYQKGVEAINITLQATATLKPSKDCAKRVSKAGIPLNTQFKPTGCPLCLDSTASAMVCRDLCLNVVRGCYASILKYKHLYLTLVKKMDEIYFTLNYHLEMQNGSLYSFIAKIEKNLKKPDFVDKCSSPYRQRNVHKQRRRQSEVPDLTHFEAFFSKQLSLESAIVDPATLPCAVANNTPPCWNGDAIGGYKHMSYSYTMEEQEANPEGADLDLTESQETAVKQMERALELCINASNGILLFPLKKSSLEGSTAPPLDRTLPTKSKYASNSVTDKTKGYTIKNEIEVTPEAVTYRNNNENSVETNVRELKTNDSSSNHKLVQISAGLFSLLQFYFLAVMR